MSSNPANKTVIAAAAAAATAIFSMMVLYQPIRNSERPRFKRRFIKGNDKNNNNKKKNNNNKNENNDNNNDNNNNNNNNTNKSVDEALQSLKPIGVVHSIYRLCVGTPRQGLLAPNAKGKIEIFQDVISSDSVLGLEDYSHVWIVFLFHLNTTTTTTNNNDNNKKKTKNKGKRQQQQQQQLHSKVAPPALGGKKVGIFSTRTPHRPNPFGVTLCRLERVEVTDDGTAVLHVSGLDLVDGTPVLDVKPYVGEYDSIPSAKVPEWVSEGLDKRRRIVWKARANAQLEGIVSSKSHSLEFYNDDSFESIKSCIEEVLSVDVRSTYQTKQLRKNKFQAERSGRILDVLVGGGATTTTTPPTPALEQTPESCPPVEEKPTTTTEPTPQVCTQQIDNLLISFTVQTPKTTKSEASKGSGAEDKVTIVSVGVLKNQKNESKGTSRRRSFEPRTFEPVVEDFEPEGFEEGLEEESSCLTVDTDATEKEEPEENREESIEFDATIVAQNEEEEKEQVEDKEVEVQEEKEVEAQEEKEPEAQEEKEPEAQEEKEPVEAKEPEAQEENEQAVEAETTEKEIEEQPTAAEETTEEPATTEEVPQLGEEPEEDDKEDKAAEEASDNVTKEEKAQEEEEQESKEAQAQEQAPEPADEKETEPEKKEVTTIEEAHGVETIRRDGSARDLRRAEGSRSPELSPTPDGLRKAPSYKRKTAWLPPVPTIPKKKIEDLGDYKSLKSYWAEEAKRNTPKGIAPMTRQDSEGKGYLVFGEQPIFIAKANTDDDDRTNTSGRNTPSIEVVNEGSSSNLTAVVLEEQEGEREPKKDETNDEKKVPTEEEVVEDKEEVADDRKEIVDDKEVTDEIEKNETGSTQGSSTDSVTEEQTEEKDDDDEEDDDDTPQKEREAVESLTIEDAKEEVIEMHL